MDDTSPTDAPRLERAVFRVQRTAVLAALLAMVAATPLAFGAPGLLAVYLVPLAAIVWVLRTQTVADGDGLTVRTVLRSRILPWSELKGLSVDKRSRVRAVLPDDSLVALPSVRARHLPALSLVSGGRITDPTEPAAEESDSEQE